MATVINVSEAEMIACWVNRLSRELSSMISTVVAEYGLSAAQAKMLLRLHFGIDSPKAIADCMGIDASNISRLTRSLEAKNLIRREVDEENRSRVILSLTDQGQSMVDQVRPFTRKAEEDVVNALSSEEREQLVATLKKLSNAICN